MKGPGGREVCFGAWFTDAEARTIRRAADRQGMDPSEWIRAQALSATRRRPAPELAATDLTAGPAGAAATLKGRLLEQLAEVMPHDLGGQSMPQHDRDRCHDCLSRRVQGLVRRGLGVPVARNLREAGSMAAPMIAQLEAASVDELCRVNAEWARAMKAREALR